MNKLQLREDIEKAINKNCAENESDTPDFILAEYLMGCLETFDKASNSRGKWYNHHCRIGGCNHSGEDHTGMDSTLNGSPSPFLKT